MKLNEVAKQTGRIYVDMDGVIADFVAGVSKLLGEPYDEARYKSDPKYVSAMWKAITKYDQDGGKLWLELPVMKDAKKLMDYVKKYRPQILTATGNKDYKAGRQKREWIKKHFGSKMKVNVVVHSRDKAKFAHAGDILIDDQPKSINPWNAASGLGILHTSAAQTIKELKKLGY